MRPFSIYHRSVAKNLLHKLLRYIDRYMKCDTSIRPFPTHRVPNHSQNIPSVHAFDFVFPAFPFVRGIRLYVLYLVSSSFPLHTTLYIFGAFAATKMKSTEPQIRKMPWSGKWAKPNEWHCDKVVKGIKENQGNRKNNITNQSKGN